MFCNIVFFNVDHTDFLIFGPYKSYEKAEKAISVINRRYFNTLKGKSDIMTLQMLKEKP